MISLRHSLHRSLVTLSWLLILWAGCSPRQTFIEPAPLPVLPDTPEPAPTSSPTLTGVPITYESSLPSGLIDILQVAGIIQEPDQPDTSVVTISLKGERQVGNWVYAMVAPFPTIPDDMPYSQLLSLWQNNTANTIPFNKILVTENTRDVFENKWGLPGTKVVIFSEMDQLIEECWRDRTSIAIIPFDELQPSWKVISIDQLSPLDKDFSDEAYGLSIPIYLQGPENLIKDTGENTQGISSIAGLIENRHPDKLTSLALTGVTALVRGTASTMEMRGLTYPATDIRQIFLETDLVHINNEVPFATNCPFPYPPPEELVFCSRPNYLDLLLDIGTDIVELTGDHFQDWGTEAVLFTLDLYEQHDIQYYGGGRNLSEGRKPLLINHNGNRLALIGCNGKEPGYAGATEDSPGAVSCDFDWLETEIRRLGADDYLPIVTFQHLEYYDYRIIPELQKDFQRVASAGAVIVSGSQAHQPHGYELFKGSFLHYGLGNLFFDQYYEGIPTREALIDRHYFYDGRHISTEVITIVFVDLARTIPMTQDERNQLLEKVFSASIWPQVVP